LIEDKNIMLGCILALKLMLHTLVVTSDNKFFGTRHAAKLIKRAIDEN